MSRLPSEKDVLEWVKANPDLASRRDIARAFHVRGQAKTDLKVRLRAMRKKGLLASASTGKPSQGNDAKRDAATAKDNRYIVVKITSQISTRKWQAETNEGDVFVVDTGDMPVSRNQQALIRVLAIGTGDNKSTAQLVRVIERSDKRFIARFIDSRDGGALETLNMGKTERFQLEPNAQIKPKAGDIVEAERLGAGRGVRRARVVRLIGNEASTRILTDLSIEEFQIRVDFPKAAQDDADSAHDTAPKRKDLTKFDFLTIDPVDARDHDDALYVETHDTGFTLYVAIADVAAFVRPNTALDEEAFLRGNSVYFPDRVVPMLPEVLSADRCSLHEDVARPVMVAKIDINSEGEQGKATFYRATIRSRASLAYETAQGIEDGVEYPDLKEGVAAQVKTQFQLYYAMRKAREKRAPLHIDLPERKIILRPDGSIDDIRKRERFDAHKLIEEAMIAANVAAAKALHAAKIPLLYRVHDEPKPEKIENLARLAKASGYSFRGEKTAVTPRQLNLLLDGAKGEIDEEMVNQAVLRSMTQAFYTPHNIGHFGLALQDYAHFTSPIRRYADVIVHRALIRAFQLGDDGLTDDEIEQLEAIGQAISQRERTAMQAERDASDRYLAKYLEPYKNAEFTAMITTVAKFGIFARIDDIGADGFIPLRTLADDHYRFDAKREELRGARTGRVIKNGMRARVKLVEADALRGGIDLALLAVDGHDIKHANPRKSGGKPRNSKPRKKSDVKTSNTSKSRRLKTRK